MGLAVSALALIAAAWAQALPAQSEAVDPKTFPLLVFRQFCLTSQGNNSTLLRDLKQMKASHPKLLAEISSADDRAKLLGNDYPVGWVFSPAEKDKPFWLGASGGGNCEVSLFGSTSQLKEQFETELQEYAAQNGGKFYLSGDTSFLEDKSKTGFAYTVDLPKSTAYVMILQSDENVGEVGHPVQLMSIFEPK